MTDAELGKIAYEAFRDYLRFQEPKKPWDEVWSREREAWEAAAGEVADAVRAENGKTAPVTPP